MEGTTATTLLTKDFIKSHHYNGFSATYVDVWFEKAGYFKISKETNPSVFNYLINLSNPNVMICVSNGIVTHIQDAGCQ